MAVPKAPAKTVQQRLLTKSLNSQATSTDQFEYALAQDWFNQYMQKISEESTTPIEMLPLYVSLDNAVNTFIGEGIWKILISWYGLADDSSILRRPTFSCFIPVSLPTNQENIFADNNLDFLSISVGRLEELHRPRDFHFVPIYFWEQFSFLELMARRLLKVPSTSNVRMWISLAEKDNDVFFKNVDPSLLSWFSCLGSLVCAENKLVMNELKQRQSAMQAPPPESGQKQKPSSASLRVDDIFDKHSLMITICIEELPPKVNETSFAQQETFILGEVTPFVHSSAKSESEWDVALSERIEQLTLGVSEAVKTETSLLYDRSRSIVNDRLQSLKEQKAELDEFQKSLKTKEARLNSFEIDLNERDQELSSKMSAFKQNLTDFLTQKKRLEDELRRLEQQNKVSVNRVELNVGGLRYTTSTTTLLQDKDSLLASMFNGHNAVHQEKDGSYFIDRDGTHFRYILNYLRDGVNAVESFPSQPIILNELLIEAKYYNLSSLITILQPKIKK